MRRTRRTGAASFPPPLLVLETLLHPVCVAPHGDRVGGRVQVMARTSRPRAAARRAAREAREAGALAAGADDAGEDAAPGTGTAGVEEAQQEQEEEEQSAWAVLHSVAAAWVSTGVHQRQGDALDAVDVRGAVETGWEALCRAVRAQETYGDGEAIECREAVEALLGAGAATREELVRRLSEDEAAVEAAYAGGAAHAGEAAAALAEEAGLAAWRRLARADLAVARERLADVWRGDAGTVGPLQWAADGASTHVARQTRRRVSDGA